MCNHPDLFEARPIVSPFDQLLLPQLKVPSRVVNVLLEMEERGPDLDLLNLRLVDHESLSKLGIQPLCLRLFFLTHPQTINADRLSRLLQVKSKL